MNRTAALLLASAAATGCVRIDADLPEVCRSAVLQVSAPAAAKSGPVAVSQDAEFLPADVTGLTALALGSGGLAISPAGAFESVKVSLRPAAGSSAPELQLLSLSPAGSGGALQATGADLLPYAGGRIVFEAVSALLSATVTVDICAAASLSQQIELKP